MNENIYGYLYINVYKNPNKKIINDESLCSYYIYSTKNFFKRSYEPDWILFDYIEKPSNHVFKSYLDMILKYAKEGSTVVVRSLFQLGSTKLKIYKTLDRMRTKQVKLIVNEWKVDLCSTPLKVLQLSVNDLAVYENLQLRKNHCSDDTTDDNTYRKLAGYKLDEEYISKETKNRIIY